MRRFPLLCTTVLFLAACTPKDAPAAPGDQVPASGDWTSGDWSVAPADTEIEAWTLARIKAVVPDAQWTQPAGATWTDEMPTLRAGGTLPSGELAGNAVNTDTDLRTVRDELTMALGTAFWQEHAPADADGADMTSWAYYRPSEAGTRFLIIVVQKNRSAVFLSDPYPTDKLVD